MCRYVERKLKGEIMIGTSKFDENDKPSDPKPPNELQAH
jgi:hypothetical protein